MGRYAAKAKEDVHGSGLNLVQRVPATLCIREAKLTLRNSKEEIATQALDASCVLAEK